MIRLALVGDIGCGKTHIAKLFGCPVFNADLEVSKLYRSSRKCFNRLKKAIPDHIFSFPIKKSQITQAILFNNVNLKKVVRIVHPEVRRKMNNFIKKNKKKKIIVLDIPLFIENKLNKKNDILIFIDAKKKEIEKRLKRRKNFNLKIVKKLKKFQLPLEIKKRKSDFIIKNNFRNNFVKKSVRVIKYKILLNA
tara:strand:+ start:549 stop:1127 length:579 start_codon:yes stop_codon:yes gene_type:complete